MTYRSCSCWVQCCFYLTNKFCIFAIFLIETQLFNGTLASSLGLSQDSLAKKEDKLLFLTKFVWNEQGNSLFWHENFVCRGASAKQLVQLCAGAFLEIRRPINKKFVGVKHELLNYDANTDTKCVERDIHFKSIHHEPLESVPMFLCRLDKIFFNKPANTTSKFYIMSGKDRSVLFVFLDIGFDKEGKRVRNTVRPWHRIALF